MSGQIPLLKIISVHIMCIELRRPDSANRLELEDLSEIQSLVRRCESDIEIINDHRFLSNKSRCINHMDLNTIIENSLIARDVQEWMMIFKAQGVPVGPLNDLADVVKDPQINARGMLIDTLLSNGEKILTAASPVKFIGDEPFEPSPAPKLDEHRLSLLKDGTLARPQTRLQKIIIASSFQLGISL